MRSENRLIGAGSDDELDDGRFQKAGRMSMDFWESRTNDERRQRKSGLDKGNPWGGDFFPGTIFSLSPISDSGLSTFNIGAVFSLHFHVSRSFTEKDAHFGISHGFGWMYILILILSCDLFPYVI